LSATGHLTGLARPSLQQGSKNPGFFKKPNPVGFVGFLDKQEKKGKIIQKLSNLKP